MTTFWKELNFRINICSLCIMTICYSTYFPLWFRERYLGSDCIVPGHYLPFTLHSNVFRNVTICNGSAVYDDNYNNCTGMPLTCA